MPQIVRCEETNCRYNEAAACRAGAVTIGVRRRPVCESRSRSVVQSAIGPVIGTVEICHMRRCVHNENSLCTAFSGVSLVMRGTDPHCALFKAAEVPLVASGETKLPAELDERARPSRVIKAPLAS